MVHPTGMRQVFIPWQSSGQHPPLPNQRHSIPIIHTNWRHNAANPTTPWLSSHAGRCHTLLPRKQYDVSSAQQPQLLKWAKSMKPGGRALLSFNWYNCPIKQWGNTDHSTYHKDCYVILAGNVGDMLATCRWRVEMSPIFARHACWCQHQNFPNTEFCVGFLATLYHLPRSYICTNTHTKNLRTHKDPVPSQKFWHNYYLSTSTSHQWHTRGSWMVQ